MDPWSLPFGLIVAAEVYVCSCKVAAMNHTPIGFQKYGGGQCDSLQILGIFGWCWRRDQYSVTVQCSHCVSVKSLDSESEDLYIYLLPNLHIHLQNSIQYQIPKITSSLTP